MTDTDRTELPPPLRAALEQFGRESSKYCDELSREKEDIPAEGDLFHYTDDRGLRGIVTGGTLWLTDIFSLNDPSELRHGINLALRELALAADNGPHERTIFAERLRETLETGIEDWAHWFVCCFSRNDDELGQWRAYADDGRGYAVGFNSEMLIEAFNGQGGPQGRRTTFAVTYDDDELRRHLAHVVNLVAPRISAPRNARFADEHINRFMVRLSVELALRFFQISIHYKHPGYSPEEEYRFLEMYPTRDLPDDIHTRTRPYVLIPYREFTWGQALSRINIGPAAHDEIARPFAVGCLREGRRGEVPIGQSAIPYRSTRTV